ncbi:MAG TPA: DUF2330 domain-containing protein [Burkholderiales bacterium]|nr:DUF2330 domain-containing protein [Burkholderiales bacterium]
MAWGSGIAACALLLAAGPAHAFCGFFVGKADANLWNDASRVVMVRDGSRTTINMLNDYQGDLKEFALVVPVPPRRWRCASPPGSRRRRSGYARSA